jgi:hypothetical protein
MRLIVWGTPCCGWPGTGYMKKKKESSNYDTKKCKNRSIKRMVFKFHFLQLNCIGLKNFKEKEDLCKKSLEFSFKSGSKRPHHSRT